MSASPPRDRYSTAVRLLRIALPLVALALVASIFVLSNSSALRKGLPVSTPQMAELALGQKIINPRFSGVTEGGDAYLLVADTAVPDGPDPTFVDLERPHTTIDFDNENKYWSKSQTGTIDLTENVVTMTETVEMHLSNGWNAYSEHMILYYQSGNAHSPGPIYADGPFGTVEAQEMVLTQNLDDGPDRRKRLLQFKNKVKVIYLPQKNEASSDE